MLLLIYNCLKIIFSKELNDMFGWKFWRENYFLRKIKISYIKMIV